MNQPRKLPRSGLGSLLLIAAVLGSSAAAFAYTAGWLSPQRLTPEKMVEALTPPSGVPLGHRRNHAKGVCFTGVFEANGNGVSLSRAGVFVPGRYPVLGRFNLGTADPNAADAKVRVRGMGLSISAADGQEWRTAMISPPVFPVSTPQAFHGLLLASASKDPNAMKAFASANPEFVAFASWAKSAPWTGSYAEEPYNSLNSFIFTDGTGGEHAVRWSLVPAAQPVAVSQADLEKRGPDFLEQEIGERVRTAGPQRWTMVVTAADPGDPTADPSKAWPQGRRTVPVGTLVVQRIEPERDGPCREINFDPTVLPPGIRVSDDPFPAARSAVYRKSYDLRTAEAKDYPANGRSQAMTGVPERFTLIQRMLHWLMAACIIAMLFIGVGMVSTIRPKYLPLVSTHKTLGVVLLVLVLIRLALRLYYGAPPLPADLPGPIKLGAKLSHLALYGLMIMMPLLGLGMLWAAAYPVVLYGGIRIPALLMQSDGVHTLLWNAHFYLGFAFFAVVLLHVAAALFHALIRRDGVFEAIAPLPLRDGATRSE